MENLAAMEQPVLRQAVTPVRMVAGQKPERPTKRRQSCRQAK
jgi:hypothetical protein